MERITGGIAFDYLFADGKIGKLVVAPASTRVQMAHGFYGISVPEVSVPYLGAGLTPPDSHTGLYNTDILASPPYSLMWDESYEGSIQGSPAANYCKNLIFEGCDDYFYPNKEELYAIMTQSSAIDALDNTTGKKIYDIFSSYQVATSSTQVDTLWCWGYKTFDPRLYHVLGKYATPYWIIPCRRVLNFVPGDDIFWTKKTGLYEFEIE